MTHINKDFLKDKKHIHFIGIGGSGMFPAGADSARDGVLHPRFGQQSGGHHRFCSDSRCTFRSPSDKARNIEGADLIVHTSNHG